MVDPVLERLRVMVVDDNHHMVTLVKTILRGFGMKDVFEAHDAVEGIEIMRATAMDFLIVDIAMELPKLAEKARERKLGLEDMQGGTITVSNLGGLGGHAFTPIVNAPEVAILGVSRSTIAPVWQNGQFAPRLMLPLSLSYDHRVIDGADAARFARYVCETLEQPWSLFLE